MTLPNHTSFRALRMLQVVSDALFKRTSQSLEFTRRSCTSRLLGDDKELRSSNLRLFQMAIRLSLHAQLIAAQGHPCFSFLQSSQCRSHEISPAARPAATSSALLLSHRFVEPTRVMTQKRGALLTKSGGGGGSGGSDSSSKFRLQRDQEAFAQEWCR